MDDSRHNNFGSHCLNDDLLSLPSPMGEEEKNETLYLLRRTNLNGKHQYISSSGTWRGSKQSLMNVYIDSTQAQRAVATQYPGFEIEEISGIGLIEKLKGRQGIKFHYVGEGVEKTLDIPDTYISQYDKYHNDGRTKVSTSEFLASFPKVEDAFSARQMKTIRETFQNLNIENANLTIATLNLNGQHVLVVDFDRAGGFTRKERARIHGANRKLGAQLRLEKTFFINAEIDLDEPPERTMAEKRAANRSPAAVARAEEKRKNRKKRRGNGKPKNLDDGFVCAEFNKIIRKKHRTMQHPLVAHLAQAVDTRTYAPFPVEVLDDEEFDLLLHLDADGEYIVTENGIDIFIDEPMWKRAHNPKIHKEFNGQKTIRELLGFAEENKAPLRLFYPDKDQISFITVPFEQLHAYYSQMPREISSDIETLHRLPRDTSDQSIGLVAKAEDHFRGIPGTSITAYVANANGRPVLVVEVGEIKPLTDRADDMLFGRSEIFEGQLPDGVSYLLKVVPEFDRATSQSPLGK